MKEILFNVVDSCWLFSTELSDAFRSFFLCMERSKNHKKKYIITVQKIHLPKEV